jgi:hypothetical protein
MQADLESRIAYLEWRLAMLEDKLGHAPAAPPRPTDLETAFGLTWLNRVGAALVIAGLTLGALWANQRGYLSPLARNLLLAAASALVLCYGVRTLRTGDAWRGRFALGIAAVGAFGLYLVPFTASRIDAVVAPAGAAALGAALTIGLWAAATWLRLPALASLALLGGLTTALAGDGTGGAAAGLALVAVLYLVDAIRRRPLSVADHAALLIAGGGAVALAVIATGSPWSIAAVGAAVAAGSMALTAADGDEVARDLTFATAAVVCCLAWTWAAYRWSVGAPAAWLRVSAALVTFGLLLVGVGVGRADRLSRLIGVAILGAAAIKLVGYDLWHFDLGLRVAGLFLLGAGLLAGSFLYSRYAAR